MNGVKKAAQVACTYRVAVLDSTVTLFKAQLSGENELLVWLGGVKTIASRIK